MAPEQLKNSTTPFDALAFLRLSSLLTRGWGMVVHDGNRRHVERAAYRSARQAHMTDTEFVTEVEKRPGLAQELICRITIGETYFFRHHEHFTILREAVVPEILRADPNRTKVRAWSAACSTGEEPYSIAIALRASLPPHVQVDVLGTDVNTESLKKAVDGAYGRWSDRTPFDDGNLLIRTGENIVVTPHLKSMVHFSRMNLVEESYPSIYTKTLDLDVVFCRNVLIYFTTEVARDVLRKLSECLAPGGCLFTSALDIDLAPPHLIRWGFRDSTVILRRPPNVVATKTGTSQPISLQSTTEAPPEPRIYVAEAVRLSNAGLSTQAIAHLRENMQTAPDPSAMLLLALLLYEQEKLDALPMLRKLVSDYPRFLQGHLHLGLHLRAAGLAAESQGHFKHILDELNDAEDQTVLPGPTDLPVGYVRRLVLAHLRRGIRR